MAKLEIARLAPEVLPELLHLLTAARNLRRVDRLPAFVASSYMDVGWVSNNCHYACDEPCDNSNIGLDCSHIIGS